MRSLAKNAKKKNPAMKRGEKEAQSLKRRRIIKNVISIATVTAVCVLVVGSIYLWRAGSVTNWVNTSGTKVEKLLIDAGLVVENIDVVGAAFLQEEDVLRISEVRNGDALLSMNIDGIIDRIEQLEWIESATVRRDFSGDVIISVQEHQPAAIWQVDNKLWIVSDKGVRITDQKLEHFADLPMISGIGAEKELHGLIKAVSSNQTMFERVETATWVGERRWDLILKNGIKIMMPEIDLTQAWLNLSELEQEDQLLARNILAIDFRVKDKTVVRLTPEEASRRRLLAKTSGKGKEI